MKLTIISGRKPLNLGVLDSNSYFDDADGEFLIFIPKEEPSGQAAVC